MTIDAETQAWFDEAIDLMEFIDDNTDYVVLGAGEDGEGAIVLTVMKKDELERETKIPALDMPDLDLKNIRLLNRLNRYFCTEIEDVNSVSRDDLVYYLGTVLFWYEKANDKLRAE